jgi:F-type H+-transporting ATPase subunit a
MTEAVNNNPINNIEENTDVKDIANTGAEVHEGVSHEATLFAEHIGHVGPLPVTNALLTSWIAVAIIVVISLVLKLKLKQIPTGIQNFFEMIFEGALSLCDQVTGSRKISEKVFPLAFSIFLFVLVNNWIGILPFGGFGLIEAGEHGRAFIPFIRSGTADVNTTLALGVISVIGANIFGIVSIGLWKTFNKYVNLKALGGMVTKVKKDPTVLIIAPITFFVSVLELIGEFAKIASLSFRLFGNVFAGEVLLLSMSAIMAYGLPIPFLFLEVFVGAIQASIFAILVLVYFTIASQDHDAHDEEHREEHGQAHA